MDDIQLVASIAAGDLLAFRDSQFPLAFVNANPGIFLSSDWVHPAQLRAFLAGHDALNSTCQATSSIKLEPSRASVFISPQEPHVKTEDLDAPTIDLVSPARASMYSTVQMCYFVENRTEIIEILSSDDEMEVEASLWLSGMSSDPPDPSHFLDHNDSNEDPQDPASNQESFETSGSGDQTTTCALFNGRPVEFYHTRHTCKGIYCCSKLDMSLVNVIRFELDPASRAGVVSVEIATRMSSGDTPEKLAAAFFRVITSRKCKAIDAIGEPCEGHPIMKARISGAFRKGSSIGCSEWTATWRNHQSDSIPDNVGLMSPQAAFSSGSKTEPCSRIISPHIGLRQNFCGNASRTLGPFYLVDELTLDVDKVYRKCVRAAGVLGTTVQSISIPASTTILLLKGQSPAMFHPSFHTKRRKQGIIRSEKLLASPEGLGVGGNSSTLVSMCLLIITKSCGGTT
ncbi:hypothetical protein B0H14DRAFT_3685071 [Mycena olivaceomarginata]|nr:hypothetical protein B0H14DRAFT_3685071 [Mycena olivaceomarginata]